MEDSDFAFAYEAIARAYAISGDRTEAVKFIEKSAKKAGEAIQEQADRDVLPDFNSGEWHGSK